nr:ankyrin repeat domain-containing protein 30A-like isoform X1 [Ipomoea batatas]GME16482.1 ankyrin repeat domain-containing protein 30A-like isoform X1 [Ipomoea batatas]
MQSGQISGSLSFNGTMTKEDEEMSRSALSTFKAKEEEIEKKKLEVREKVQAQLGRIEEETRRLATIREELEALADPMKKEVSLVRKKIDTVNKELKPLGQTCQKKEREYKEALEAFNEKHKEKVQLITRLTEVSNVGFHCFSQFHYSSLPHTFNHTTYLPHCPIVPHLTTRAAGEREREVEDEEVGGAEQEHRNATLKSPPPNQKSRD